MPNKDMTKNLMFRERDFSLRTAAVIAGVGVLIMAFTVPVVEFYIFPKLIDFKNGVHTTNNILAHRQLFSTAIFIHFITVICDVLVAWALYIFLKPVNKNLALLTAWFRIVYTAFNIAALLNLIQVLSLLRSSGSFVSFSSASVQDYVLFNVNSFNLQWRFGLVFFGVYLLLLGYLVLKASYVPNSIGVFLIVAAIGYLMDDLKYFFYPDFNTGFLWFTFFGELVFMFWLLIMGSRIQTDKIIPGTANSNKTSF
jgi:hypothetical protein